MNAQEREQLTQFLQQLAQAQVGAKDGEAEKLILDACARQPDAAYLLVQRSLLLNQALQNAQAEIARLQKVQEAPASSGGSFLNSSAWGNTLAQMQPAQRPVSLAPPPLAPVATPGWGSGMLGTVATTAAGVVAGSFLFQGIESLMGHHGHNAGLLSGNNPAPSTNHAPPESLVANHVPDVSPPLSDLDALGPDTDGSDWTQG